jgi:hypothetical protein
MLVKVTQDHINKSLTIKNGEDFVSSKCCPIALAIKDLGYRNVRVYEQYVKLDLFSVHNPISLPPIAVSFIEDFDITKEVFPLEFELCNDDQDDVIEVKIQCLI